mmetsp:Transcript_5215/g.16468  ORF Transcript_5215/g.16468 Transcript_5215/m.16468 type:complete len:212 (-) Transcript_5215:225-860(-)
MRRQPRTHNTLLHAASSRVPVVGVVARDPVAESGVAPDTVWDSTAGGGHGHTYWTSIRGRINVPERRPGDPGDAAIEGHAERHRARRMRRGGTRELRHAALFAVILHLGIHGDRAKATCSSRRGGEPLTQDMHHTAAVDGATVRVAAELLLRVDLRRGQAVQYRAVSHAKLAKGLLLVGIAEEAAVEDEPQRQRVQRRRFWPCTRRRATAA